MIGDFIQMMLLKAINTKILIGILATLTMIAGLIYRNHQANLKAAAAAAQAEQQRKHQQEAEALRKAVEEKRKQHNNNAGNGSKTWAGSYRP
jgi:Tfp pilus assembly major pilin PilA